MDVYSWANLRLGQHCFQQLVNSWTVIYCITAAHVIGSLLSVSCPGSIMRGPASGPKNFSIRAATRQEMCISLGVPAVLFAY